MLKQRLGEMVLGTLVVGGFFLLMGTVGNIETHYTRKNCEVMGVHGTRLVIDDDCGYTWEYEVKEGEEIPEVGDKVKLKMFTGYTDGTVYDDEVVKVIVKK